LFYGNKYHFGQAFQDSAIEKPKLLLITQVKKNSQQIFGCLCTNINSVIYQDLPCKRTGVYLQTPGFGGLSEIDPRSLKIASFQIYKGKIEKIEGAALFGGPPNDTSSR
jgi:hypothetical protein